jgi:hypothetical protein
MYEQNYHPNIPFRHFLGRLFAHFLIATGFVMSALAIGILGYHFLAKFSWIDSIMNAAMILTGMGPVGPLSGTLAKLWASAYALFSGLIFITSMGVAATPIVHRLLHKFHLEDSRRKQS